MTSPWLSKIFLIGLIGSSVFSLYYFLRSFLPVSFVNESTGKNLPDINYRSLLLFFFFFSFFNYGFISHLLISLLLHQWIAMLEIYLLDPLVFQKLCHFLDLNFHIFSSSAASVCSFSLVFKAPSFLLNFFFVILISSLFLIWCFLSKQMPWLKNKKEI